MLYFIFSRLEDLIVDFRDGSHCYFFLPLFCLIGFFDITIFQSTHLIYSYIKYFFKKNNLMLI